MSTSTSYYSETVFMESFGIFVTIQEQIIASHIPFAFKLSVKQLQSSLKNTTETSKHVDELSLDPKSNVIHSTH